LQHYDTQLQTLVNDNSVNTIANTFALPPMLNQYQWYQHILQCHCMTCVNTKHPSIHGATVAFQLQATHTCTHIHPHPHTGPHPHPLPPLLPLSPIRLSTILQSHEDTHTLPLHHPTHYTHTTAAADTAAADTLEEIGMMLMLIPKLIISRGLQNW
jgi:hypothetical protein